MFAMNISEIAEQLQTALKDSQHAHAELETAKQKLTPLQLAADDADAKVHSLMSEYGKATGGPSDAPLRKRKGSGAKRAPRQFLAIAMTTGSRLMKAAKTEGKQKKAALQAAIERLAEIAAKRGESLTDEIKAAVEKRAAEIWTK
jgi:hypothetical protein